MTIEQLIDNVIAIEGNYSNHPADRGGPTRWGITEAVARSNGYAGEMRHFPHHQAVAIYKRNYWQHPGFDKINEHAPRLAEELFDTGINMGSPVAIGFLQRALNALNRNGQDFSDIKVDRKIGPATVGALKQILTKRGKSGETVLLKAVEALQGERYIKLAEQRPANEAFLYGWLANRIS
ncbi:MAG: glycosyl hydrolase 108 family protein [Parasphingorhabdus sp.]|uniref:glycoside hydrolase family 108 protein n=1 Tax=Parasphingorhabdus sp. TaxID=2709688 RepID=UPI003003A344